jgi:hypothetical protein
VRGIPAFINDEITVVLGVKGNGRMMLMLGCLRECHPARETNED